MFCKKEFIDGELGPFVMVLFGYGSVATSYRCKINCLRFFGIYLNLQL